MRSKALLLLFLIASWSNLSICVLHRARSYNQHANKALINLRAEVTKQDTSPNANQESGQAPEDTNPAESKCNIFFTVKNNSACHNETLTLQTSEINNHALIECDGVDDILVQGAFCLSCSMQVYQDFGYEGGTFGFYLKTSRIHLSDFAISDKDGKLTDSWDQAISSYTISCELPDQETDNPESVV